MASSSTTRQGRSIGNSIFTSTLAVALALSLAAPASLVASVVADWTGATSGDISDPNQYNLAPALTATTDLQFFNLPFSNVPSTNGTLNLSVAGLIFAGAQNPGLAINIGGQTLMLGADGVSDSALNSIELSLPITLTANQAWTNNSAFALTVDALNAGGKTLAFGGTGNTTFTTGISNLTTVTKSGAGTLTLASGNSTSGLTISAGTITGGALTLTGGATALTSSATSEIDSSIQISTAPATVTSSAGTLTLGGTFDVNGTGLLTFAGAGNTTFTAAAISNLTTLTKSGAGTLTLFGTNSSSGAVTINAGTIAGGTLTLNGGATALTSSATSEIDSSIQISTAPATVTSSAGTLTLGGTFDVNGSGLLTFAGAGNTTFTAAAISNLTTLTKSGAGTLTLFGTNSSSGAVTINAGTIAGGTLTLNGGATALTSTATSAVNSNIVIATNPATITNNGGTLTLGGSTLDAGGFALTFAGGNPTTVNNLASDGTITQNGTGTLILTNTGNTYSSTTITNTGALQANAPGTLGAGSVTLNAAGGANLNLLNDGDLTGATQNINYGNAVVVSNNGTILVNRLAATALDQNKNFQLGGLTIGAFTLTVTNNNQDAVEFTGASTLTGTPTFSVTNLVGAVNQMPSAGLPGMKISGLLSGSGFIKTGNGILALTNINNNFVGNISVTAGLLSVTSEGAMGDPTNGGVGGNTITLNGGSGVGLQAAASFSTARIFTLGASGGTIDVTSGNSLTLSAADALAGAFTLFKNNDGTLVLGGDNISASTWTGILTIQDGAVQATNSNALGSLANPVTVSGNGAALQLANGVTIGAKPLSLNGSGSESAGALENFSGANTYGGAITLATASTIGSDASTLTLTGAITGAQALTFAGAGAITINSTGSIGAVSSVTKINSGTVTLSVPSTSFVGALTVNAGTFRVDTTGQLGITGLVTVNPGATLTLDNVTAYQTNRLNGRALTLNGGTFNLTGTSTAQTLESIGALTIGTSGASLVNLTPDPAKNLKLTFASWARSAGATAVFQDNGTASGLGAHTIASITANESNVVFTAAPALIPAAGTIATPNYGIIASALVTDVTAGTTNFATYDATNGLRQLAGTESTTTIGTGNNILVNGSDLNVVSANYLSGGAAASFTINSLILSGAGNLNAAGWITTVTSGGILSTSTNKIKNSSVLAFAGVEAVVHTVGGANTLTVDALINGTAGLTKADAGTLVLTTNEQYTGTTTINGGKVSLTSGADNTLGVNQSLVVNPGGILNLNGHSQLVGAFSSAGTVAGAGGTVQSDSGTGTLFTNTGTSTTFAGTIAGSVNLIKQGTSALTLSGGSNVIGATTVSGGTLTLIDAGAVTGTGGIALNYATLSMNNTGTLGSNSRLSSSNPITSAGGTITLLGRTSDFTTQGIGQVTLAGGQTTITDTVDATNTHSNSTTLTINGFGTRTLGATVSFTGNALGAIANNSAMTNVTGQANGLIGGWATVNNGDMATYVAGLGVGALGSTGFPIYDTTFGVSTNTNLTVTTALPNTGGTGNPNLANALRLQGAINVTFAAAGDVLNLTSGALIGDNGNSARAIGTTGTPGVLTAGGTASSGTDELFFHINQNTTTVNSVIKDTNVVTGNGTAITALVKDLGGTVTLTAANLYTGGTFVNAGTLSLGGTNTNVLPATGGIFINSGATLSEAVAGQITNTATVTLNGGGTLTLVGANTLANITFNGTGGTSTPTVNSGGVLTLTSGINATISNLAVNPTIAGTLDLNASSTFPIAVTGGVATVGAGATGGFSAASLTISAVIQDGGIVKSGTGMLVLSGTNNFTGPVKVIGGVLQVNNNISVNTNGNLGNSNTAIALGDDTGSSNNVLLQLNSTTFARNITVNSTHSGTVTIQATGGNAVNLNGNVTLSSDLVIDALGHAITTNGIISGTGNVTFSNTSAGSVNASQINNPANNWSGTTTITGGDYFPRFYSLPFNTAVTIDGGVSGTTELVLSASGSNSGFQIGSLNDPTNGDSSGYVLNVSNAFGTLVLGTNAVDTTGQTSTYSGDISGMSGQVPANGSFGSGSGRTMLVKLGNNTQIINAPISLPNDHFNGNYFVLGGTFGLGPNGRIADTGPGNNNGVGNNGTAFIFVAPQATLALDSTTHTSTPFAREAVAADAQTIELGGAITLKATASGSDTTDSMGALAVRSGAASITITPDSSHTSTLAFGGTVSRTGSNAPNGSDGTAFTANGTILFSGPNIGNGAAVTGTANTARITFSAAPVTITGGSLTTTGATVIPWAYGFDSSAVNEYGLVTYDTNGIRLLNDGTTNAANINLEYTSTFTTAKNVLLTASSLPATGFTIQSLYLNAPTNGSGAITLGNGSAITLAINEAPTAGGSAGTILNVGGNSNTTPNSIASGVTLSYSNEAIFITVNDLNMNGLFSLSNKPFTKSGAGTLTLAPSAVLNTTSLVTVDQGILKLGVANSLNGATGTQVALNQGGTLDINGFGQTITSLTGYSPGQLTNGTLNQDFGEVAASASSSGGTLTNNGAANATVTLVGTTNDTFTGGITDGSHTVALLKTIASTNTQTFWTNLPGGYSYSGGTTINNGTIKYNVSTVQTFSLGSGTVGVTLNGGNLEVDPWQFNGAMPNAIMVGTTAYGSVNFTTPITVTALGGGLYGEALGQTNLGTNFTGTIALAGMLAINGQGNSGNAVTNRYQGAITLNQTATGALPVLLYNVPFSTGSGALNLYTANIDSVITDGVTSVTAVNPLALRASTFTQVNVSGLNGQSTYANGTIVQGSVNLVALGQTVGTTPTITYSTGADARLGTGNVYIQPGSKVVMNAADNINTPANGGSAAITLSGSTLSQGVLDLAFAYSGTQANLGIAASSTGIVGIDNAGFTTSLDMSGLGNGNMFLGSVSAGTYGGASLTVASDNVYRLGGGGGTLTVTNAVLAGATSLVVGENAGVVGGGIGPVSENSQKFFYGNNIPNGGSGSVVLSAANGFTGSVTVNLGSSLTAPANLTTALFGLTNQALALNGGSLQVVGLNNGVTGSNVQLGTVSINGFGKIGVSANGNVTGTNILTVTSLAIVTKTRDYVNNPSTYTRDIFIVDPSVTGASPGTELKVNDNGPAALMQNGILPGNYISATNSGATTQGNFLAYTAGAGFAPYAGYVVPTAAWANITNIGTQVVNDNGGFTLNVSTPVSIYGMKMSTTGALNLNGNTLNVGAGGIIFSFDDGNTAGGPQITGNVNFGANEGFIYTATYAPNGVADRNPNISGSIIGSNGLTISGPGIFSRPSAAGGAGFKGLTGDASGIVGPVTLNQATLALWGAQTTGMPNSAIPDYDNYVLNGGTITQQSGGGGGGGNTGRFGMSLMGTVTLGPEGGILESSQDNSGSTTEGNAINGQITGSGVLSLQGQGGSKGTSNPFYIYNAANNYTGGTVMNNPVGFLSSVNVLPGSNLGTGDVVDNGSILNLNGSANIASGAQVTVGAFSTINLQSGSLGSPGMFTFGAIAGSGNLVLGKTATTNADNLTVGGANLSTLFDGIISAAASSPAFGLSASGLTKVGSGTLSLAGLNTYTGITTVSAGTINLINGLSLQNTPVSVTPVNGLTFTAGLKAASLGALWGADNFALADTGANALALTIGGTNLNAVSTGGMSGAGSLIKAGTGIQAIGANTFTGAVTINGGVLRATSGTSLSNSIPGVTVNNGGNLDFASANGLGGVMNVATLTLATGSGIGAEVGVGSINVVGATSTTGTINVDIYGTAGFNGASNTYTLVTAPNNLNLAAYQIGRVYNNTNFTVTSVQQSGGTSITATIANAAPIATAFLKTGTVLALSGNWATASGGGAQALVPGSTAAVTLDNTDSAPTVTLGANMTFGNTTIASNAGAVTLNTDGYGLTVSGSLSVLDTSTVTLNVPVTVNGQISVNTTGTTIFNGPLAGSGMVTKQGTGTTIIGGTSSYTGPMFVMGTGSTTVSTLVLGPGATTSGSINVFNGGQLQINAAGILTVASAGSVNLLAAPVIGGPAVIATGLDFPANQLFLNAISSTSKGIIVLGTDTAANLDFSSAVGAANLPNMFLGSTTAAGATLANMNLGVTYYGSSLTPNGGTYRLGGGNGVLSIYNSVLVGNSNSLIVGQISPVGVATAVNTPTGTVNLRAANTLNGGITVNNGSTLIGLAQGTGSPFGATDAVTINGGILQLEGDPARQLSNNVGAVTVESAGSVLINNFYGQQFVTQNTSLTLASIARTNNGTLFVGTLLAGASSATNALGGATTETSKVFVTSPSGTGIMSTTSTNGGTILTTPFAFNNLPLSTTNSGFVTYGANGFAPAVPTRLDTGAALTLVGAAASSPYDLVYVTGSDSSLNGVGTTTTIQDLTINGAFAITATNSPTLAIAGGGIVTSNNANSIGVLNGQYPIVQFGATGTAEGIIDVQVNTFTINSQVHSTSGGLTKTGTGTLALTNVSATPNDFVGTITINQGTVAVAFNLASTVDSLGNASNTVLLDGGTLSLVTGTAPTSPFTFARAIALGAVGGRLFNNNGGTANITGAINGATGTGPLVIAGTNTCGFDIQNAGNTYIGGTVLSETSNNTMTVTVESGSSLGTGDVDLLQGNAITLNLLGNANIPGSHAGNSQARLNIDSGHTVVFKSLTPTIGTLEGAGNVQLGASGTGTVLTVGNNTDTLLSQFALTGTITPFAGSSASGITKVGTGTFTMLGTNTYAGTTTISGGVLQANDNTTANAGAASVLLNAGLITAGLPGTNATNGGSYLILNGGVLQSYGSASFIRALSGTVGGGNFEFNTNGGGFAANSGVFTVNVGNASAGQTWGTTVGSQIVGTLMFGSTTANNQVNFVNPIDLNNGARTIQVVSGAGGDSALLSGVISDSPGAHNGATLAKTGTGNLILSNTETYLGETDINAGTLTITGTLGSGTVVVNNTGTLAGTGTISGNVTLNNGGIINLTNPATIVGTVTDPGGFWNGNGSVQGDVNVTSGTLSIGPVGNLTALSPNGVTVSGTGAIASTLNNTTATITGNVNYTSSASSTYYGIIAGGGKTLNVNSATGGTLRVNGANTYTGTTTVSNGTLIVGGSLLTSGITVNGSGARLLAATTVSAPLTFTQGTIGGTGTFAESGIVIGSGQTVSPGGIASALAPGTLAFSDVGGLTFGNGGTYQFKVNATNTSGTASAGTISDLINITGALTINATFTLNVNSLAAGNVAGSLPGFAGNGQYQWEILTATGGVPFNPGSLINVTSSSFMPPELAGNFTVVRGDDPSVISGGTVNNLWLEYAFNALPQWFNSTGSDWATGNNWSNLAPPLANSTARLWDQLTSSANPVTLPDAGGAGGVTTSVATLSFHNTVASYTVSALHSTDILSMDNGAGTANIQYESGNTRDNTISAPVTFTSSTNVTLIDHALTLSGALTYGTNATVTVVSGTLNLNPSTAATVNSGSSLVNNATVNVNATGSGDPFSGIDVTNNSALNINSTGGGGVTAGSLGGAAGTTTIGSASTATLSVTNAITQHQVTVNTNGTLNANGALTTDGLTVAGVANLSGNTSITGAGGGLFSILGPTGNVSFSGTNTLTINANQSHTLGSTLTLYPGSTTNMNTDAGSTGNLNLAISIAGNNILGPANLTFGTVGTSLSEHLASLTIHSNAVVTVEDGGTPTGGGVTLGTGKVLVTGALAFDGNYLAGYGGQLNLKNNAMVLKGAAGAYNAVQTQLNVDLVLGLLASGYDGGLWDGQGLISSTAAANKDHLAVGYATGEELDPSGNFMIDGETVGVNDVVVSFTKPGDYAMVGGTSFPAIADVLGHEGTNQDWYNGGFTYGVLDHTSGMVQYDANNNPLPGAVSFPDFVAVLNNIGNHFGDAQEVTPVVPSVPEPASLGLLALGALALLKRSRRSR